MISAIIRLFVRSGWVKGVGQRYCGYVSSRGVVVDLGVDKELDRHIHALTRSQSLLLETKAINF